MHIERPMVKVFIHRKSNLWPGVRAGEVIIVHCDFTQDPFQVAQDRLKEIGAWDADMILSRNEWWKK